MMKRIPEHRIQMINDSFKMGKYYGDSYVRYDGENVEFDPEEEEELYEHYESIREMIDVMEPTETSKESVLSHQQARTIKKTNKKKSMEQRARQKKSPRIDVVLEMDE